MPEMNKDTAKKRAMLRACVAFFAAVVFYAGVMILSAQDANALRVTMKRIVFEGPVRTELITIVNNTAEEQVYRLGWRMMRMTEDTSLEYVKEGESTEGLMPAEDMIRYSPRRVVLPPGASQQVRLMLRRPKDLAPGEYRSHFWIQPEAEAVKFDPNPDAPKDKPSIQIKMLTGLTLPVFVRNGDLSASASITNLQMAIAGGSLQVTFDLNREGNRSLYGDMDFVCVGGGETVVKQLKGIAVYTEITKRHMKFDIPLPEGGAGACQQVKVKYTAEKEDTLFKGRIMAEAASG